MTVKIEVCVDSVESAIAAQNGGADRVELCDNLFEGGTTPSYGSIVEARERLSIGLQVIIRPRGGDFLYSDLEFKIVKHDIEIAKELGVDGIVIGILKKDGSIDAERTRILVELARPMNVTFHRAFDVCANPFDSLEELVEIGVDRVLTSGQEANAFEGLEMIKKLKEKAAEHITILACGDLTSRNVRRFVNQTGVDEVHLTGFVPVKSGMKHKNERVFMGGTLRPPEFSRRVASADVIREVRKSLDE